MKVKIDEKIIEHVKNNASMVSINLNDYYFFPYWIKINEDNTVHLLRLGSLPKELQDFLRYERDSKPIIKEVGMHYYE